MDISKTIALLYSDRVERVEFCFVKSDDSLFWQSRRIITLSTFTGIFLNPIPENIDTILPYEDIKEDSNYSPPSLKFLYFCFQHNMLTWGAFGRGFQIIFFFCGHSHKKYY